MPTLSSPRSLLGLIVLILCILIVAVLLLGIAATALTPELLFILAFAMIGLIAAGLVW